MKVFQLFPVVLFCVLWGGCSGLLTHVAGNDNYPKCEPVEPIVKVVIKSPDTALDELRTYSNYFNGLTATEQSRECKHLAQTLKVDDNVLNRMRIVLALSLASECGKPVEAIEFLKPILDQEKEESLSMWFAAYQMALLERIQRQEEQLDTLQTDLKSAITGKRKLKKKLEALKSIEKSINERKGISEGSRKE